MATDAWLITIVKSCGDREQIEGFRMASGEKKRRCLWILGSCSGTAGLAKAVCLLQCLTLGGAFDISDGMGLFLNGGSWSKGSGDP